MANEVREGNKETTKNGYKHIIRNLEDMGIDTYLITYLDGLCDDEKEHITQLFMEGANEELLFILALNDMGFVKNYLQEKRE